MKSISFFRGLTRVSSALCIVTMLPIFASVEGSAQTYKIVANNSTDSYNPFIQGLDGNLYGTTNATQGTYGYGGSVIKMTPAGVITTVYQFCSLPNCTDGQDVGGIIFGTDGNIYGVTQAGGANSSIDCSGEVVQSCGTVFKLTTKGKLTTLYNFCSQTNCTDGFSPRNALVQAANGNFYGVTYYGGNSPGCPNDGVQPLGCGTVFEITPSGKFATVYSFCTQGTCSDGAFPAGPLVQGSNGEFYGTTLYGGTGFGGVQCGSQGLGCGTIFEVGGAGVLKTLYNFCIPDGCPDGAHPDTGLVLATNGLLYGSTVGGGAYNEGEVFSLSGTDTLKTIYSFCEESGCPDGDQVVGLIQASDGNFYGPTAFGGANSSGTLFKLTPAGVLTTLYSFCAETNCNDGIMPSSPLFQATSGAIYGYANGGSSGNGIVYSWTSPQLHKLVDTLPISGKVGTAVKILGNNFTGATAVNFNGTAATFEVVSASEITTTVPAGATAGKVSVTLSTGTVVSSDIKFRIP
jgi:uncharacterized repeat protein (TIGR03803 family)